MRIDSDATAWPYPIPECIKAQHTFVGRARAKPAPDPGFVGILFLTDRKGRGADWLPVYAWSPTHKLRLSFWPGLRHSLHNPGFGAQSCYPICKSSSPYKSMQLTLNTLKLLQSYQSLRRTCVLLNDMAVEELTMLSLLSQPNLGILGVIVVLCLSYWLYNVLNSQRPYPGIPLVCAEGGYAEAKKRYMADSVGTVRRALKEVSVRITSLFVVELTLLFLLLFFSAKACVRSSPTTGTRS